MEQLFTDVTFDRRDFREVTLPKGEYENCMFTHCELSGVDLMGILFVECVFSDCNLSMANLKATVFRDVQFKDCKMLGLHFEDCDAFGRQFSFEGCTLNHVSFYQVKLKKMVFRKGTLHEADFSGCDLTSAVFDGCDLRDAKFENTILVKADLRTAFNYSIDPTINGVKKARFALPAVIGLLDRFDILICPHSSLVYQGRIPRIAQGFPRFCP